MPYVDKNVREQFRFELEQLKEGSIDIYFLRDKILEYPLQKQDGIVNYLLTSLLKDGLRHPNIANELLWIVYADAPLSYFHLNRLTGILNAMVTEFTRREWSIDSKVFLLSILRDFEDQVIGPYEDKKIEENGDVE